LIHKRIPGRDASSFSAGLPKTLGEKLHSRSVDHPQPVQVALGCDGQYFMMLDSGRYYWSVFEPEVRDYMDRNTKFGFDHVCLGSNNGVSMYFISTRKNGYFIWNTPQQFKGLVSKYQVDATALGPNGEWFVRYHGDQIAYGNVGTEFKNAIREFKDRVKSVKFGNNCTYLIRYT